MLIFCQKWRKWLPLAILAPLTMIFTGGWTSVKQSSINPTNFIAKDTITYNNLPTTRYGNTPWSPMQLDLQQFDVFQGQTVQRIVPQGNDIILYAITNDAGSNAKWYEQDLTKDAEPHQILTNVTNLKWNYGVKIWHHKIIYVEYKNNKYNWIIQNKVIASSLKLTKNCFIAKNYFIYGIQDTNKIEWTIFNLNKFKSSFTFVTPILLNIKFTTNNLYFLDNKNNLNCINLSEKCYKNHILKTVNNFNIINDNYLLYTDKDNVWKLHDVFSGDFKENDKIIIKTNNLTFYDNKLFYLNEQTKQTYYLKFTFKNLIPFFAQPAILWDFNVNGLPKTKINSNLMYYTGNYIADPNNKYDFIQRWIEPSHDFNLNVAKITAYGNANKKAVIDFKFDPNWQNKTYYLNNTNYYLNYWVNNKTKVTRIPLEKNGGNYRFSLSNDDLINYDGKTLHTTISANVNGREINNIKLAQANGLFKYDDVNDTYDYIVKNYTPPYWTKARIVGLGVGCVLAIPFLVALFFWLKRQWHKIYF